MKKVDYKVGGKKGKTVELKESKDLVAVRTHVESPLQKALVTKEAKEVAKSFKVKQTLRRADVTVLQVKETVKETLKFRNKARKIFKREELVRFAGRVLVDEVSGEPVLYTENIYITFRKTVPVPKCRNILAEFELTIKFVTPQDERSFFVEAVEGTGMKIFDICKKLLARKEVEMCEPELVREKSKKNFKLPGFPKIHNRQWHLKKTIFKKHSIDQHCNIEKAYKLTKGENVTIAIIDDGVDITHPEFDLPGKIHAPFNVDDMTEDPMPFYDDDNHGTACAGVACASGQHKAAGVAPAARLMPIRNESNQGSMDEAFCFYHAKDNGADIISCSWGPKDGDPDDPDDPLHNQKHDLSQRIRDAIHYAATKGRKGKGCVVLFSAGNGNENADLDQYISNPEVIAVAACNDYGRRSIYSDYGKCIWVCFPSNDWEGENHMPPFTPGIWTTDRVKKIGYTHTAYTSDFGGTSSACPGVAGVCALMLSVNPNLTSKQVKNILRYTADKIDKKNAKYDAKGHSIYYGYGRVNAERAVKMALKMKKEKEKMVVMQISSFKKKV